MPLFDGISSWNYKTKHVQSRDGIVDFDSGNFIRGASVLLVAGPRKYADSTIGGGSGALLPIGLLQTGSISQQKQLEEVFEIGSERRYFITGRTFYQLQAQRIMVSGASLLRALYNVDVTGWQSVHSPLTIPNNGGALPGYHDYFLNLASIYFNKPTGILVLDNDNDDQVVGGAYLEDCYIQSYNRQIAAQQTVVAEQAVIKFDGLVSVTQDQIVALFSPAKSKTLP